MDSIVLFVQNNLMASASVVAMLVELGLRLIPSEAPKSILLGVSSVVHSLASIIGGIASFLDKVIPQNIK